MNTTHQTFVQPRHSTPVQCDNIEYLLEYLYYPQLTPEQTQIAMESSI